MTKPWLSIRIGSCVSGSGSLWVLHFVVYNFPFLLLHFNIIFCDLFCTDSVEGGGAVLCCFLLSNSCNNTGILSCSHDSLSAPVSLTHLLLFCLFSSQISPHPPSTSLMQRQQFLQIPSLWCTNWKWRFTRRIPLTRGARTSTCFLNSPSRCQFVETSKWSSSINRIRWWRRLVVSLTRQGLLL